MASGGDGHISYGPSLLARTRLPAQSLAKPVFYPAIPPLDRQSFFVQPFRSPITPTQLPGYQGFHLGLGCRLISPTRSASPPNWGSHSTVPYSAIRSTRLGGPTYSTCRHFRSPCPAGRALMPPLALSTAPPRERQPSFTVRVADSNGFDGSKQLVRHLGLRRRAADYLYDLPLRSLPNGQLGTAYATKPRRYRRLRVLKPGRSFRRSSGGLVLTAPQAISPERPTANRPIRLHRQGY